VSAVLKPPRATVGRVRARLRGRPEPYAFCPNDGFFFRPLYTDGKCPLCGEEAVEAAPALPLLMRFDRFRLGMALLALVSVAMSTLVLVMYFSR
jgi:rRNA maturation protein Nop10